jgi:hypothetical protein
MNTSTTAPKTHRVGRWSALGYTSVSVALAGAFYWAASFVGSYTEVAMVGGAVRVFLLSMIVSVPLATSAVKARITTKEGVQDGH